MYTPLSGFSDAELIRLFDNNPNLSELERELLMRLDKRRIPYDELQTAHARREAHDAMACLGQMEWKPL